MYETGDVPKAADQRVAILRAFKAAGTLPFFRQFDAIDPPRAEIEGRQCVVLGSNSYLGLANHPEVVEAAVQATREFGVGTTGSRVLNGSYSPHTELEQTLARWYGREDALVFTTGYQTNVGVIQALLGSDCLAVVDSLAHASIRDGIRLSRAVEARFDHNDPAALAAVLREHSKTPYRRKLILLDSLYSMEGDTAPLKEIIAIAKEFGVPIMLDEAHGVGVFGPTGAGLAELGGLGHDIDIIMGSLSKAIGCLGGFVVGSPDLVDELRVGARAFQFSTSGTPAAMAGAAAAVEIIRGPVGRERQARLEHNSRSMREALSPLDTELHRVGEQSPDWTPIIPIRLNDDFRTGQSWVALWEAGVFVTPVTYPAVPFGKSLLRVCMTTELTDADIQQCAELLVDELSWSLETV